MSLCCRSPNRPPFCQTSSIEKPTPTRAATLASEHSTRVAGALDGLGGYALMMSFFKPPSFGPSEIIVLQFCDFELADLCICFAVNPACFIRPTLYPRDARRLRVAHLNNSLMVYDAPVASTAVYSP